MARLPGGEAVWDCERGDGSAGWVSAVEYWRGLGGGIGFLVDGWLLVEGGGGGMGVMERDSPETLRREGGLGRSGGGDFFSGSGSVEERAMPWDGESS